MKILFFISSYRTGITVLLTEHILALVKQPDIQLLAVSGYGSQEPGLETRIQNAGIKLCYLRGIDEHDEMKRLVNDVSELLVKFQPDIVMIQTNWQLLLTYFAKKKTELQCKLVYWIHGYRHNSVWKSKIALPLIGISLRFFAQKVVASSQVVFNKFSPWVGKWKMCFLPLGVDQIFFSQKIKKYLDSSSIKLIFAGQFRYGKNQDWIIRAVAECRQEGYQISAILPGDGPLRSNMINLADELNISDVIDFPGNLTKKELISLYHNATLCVIASNSETFGSCIAEPIVCGLPVLTRSVGCATDIIQDGVNGLFFSSEKDLVIQLKKIINSPDLYQRIKNASNQSASYFDWNRICQEEIKMFYNL